MVTKIKISIMKKLSILLLSLIVFSCGDHEDVIYDPSTSTTFAFFNSQSTALEVLINESASAEITVGASTLSSTDRTLTLAIDEELTTASPDMYSFSTSVTIPANEYFGSFTVTAIDNGLTVDPVNLVLRIESVSDGGDVSSAVHSISMVETCPVASDFAVGTYTLTHVSGGVAAAGFAPALGDGVDVELVNGESSTERIFNVKCYPSFGFSNPAADFSFNLVCEAVVANGIVPGQASGVGCGGSITFGPGDMNGSYDVSDDSVITLIFNEDTENICGDTGVTTVTLTKVN